MMQKISIGLAIFLAFLAIYTYSLLKEIDNLTLQLNISKASNTNLNKALALQNEEIEKLKIIKRAPTKIDLSHLKSPEPNSCESELTAYKQLFKELSK